MNYWSATIIRCRERLGPGALYLYKNYELYGKYNCITGGKIIDPHEYGGLTPPINWMMIEDIKERKHPRGRVMTMARIIPVGLGKTFYLKRTYDIDLDPFMIHEAGRSTGCIAIVPEHWAAAREGFNLARSEDNFLICVRD